MKQSAKGERYPGIEFRAMNSLMAVIGRTDTPLPYWQRPVIRWFEEVEQKASRFRPDSDLSRLNRWAPGEPCQVSPTLYRLLRKAWQLAVDTDYLFQPFVGSALKRLGYDRSFEEVLGAGSSPGANFVGEGSFHPIMEEDALQFDETAFTVTRRSEAELDLGGVGKGWSADGAASFMRREFGITSGLVDAGGDLRVWSDEDPWCIGIEHPEDEETEILQLWINDAGVATSNVLHRRWKQGGLIRHHILDGRTGLPAQSDVIQATVLAPRTCEAEVAAKIICMLGADEAVSWMETHFPHHGYVMVKTTGDMIMNQKLYDYAIKVV
ncbi:FAD:protein FMN transferase [Ferviditalea candida]|uniref:FAD:protein FMN transferase n=1 Tax=Ferviditalea candida TaxID=3108399 RepID=A0ABU5ZI59_9BACL|nr:FAD:protein FMN transferase [Paenibacillaceae bacterium T2]